MLSPCPNTHIPKRVCSVLSGQFFRVFGSNLAFAKKRRGHLTEIVEKEAYSNSGALLLVLSLLAVLFAKPYIDGPREVGSEEVEAAIVERLRSGVNPSERFVLSGTIDINSAGVEELSLLPGVGESLAQSIVSRRMALGGFRTTEELKTVKGIGEAKFSAIKTYVSAPAPVLGNKKGR